MDFAEFKKEVAEQDFGRPLTDTEAFDAKVLYWFARLLKLKKEQEKARISEVRLKIEYALNLMTATQRRRWQLYLKHHSLKMIAEVERVRYQSIQNSLHAGVKRAQKRLKKQILVV
jgi:hypothetical protein